RELVGQELVIVALTGLGLDSHGVVFLVVPEASPRFRVLGKDDRPLVLGGNHVKAVGPGRESLPLHFDLVRRGERRLLVGAGTPRAARAAVESEIRHAPWNQPAPDLPPTVVLTAHHTRTPA